MKYTFYSILLLICGITFTSASYCRDNETNEEYAVSSDENSLNNIIDLKITHSVQTVKEQLEVEFAKMITTKLRQFKLELSMPSDCQEALNVTQQNGRYRIYPHYNGLEFIDVVCRRGHEKYEGDWIVIMRRIDRSLDFFRNWVEYKNGFGDFDSSFFIGLDKLHALTTFGSKQQLLIIMRNWNDEETYAKYDEFAIGNEDQAYVLNKLGNYSGDATDAFRYHINQKFTTKDVDNDKHSTLNCAHHWRGAWWFKHCHDSHLFGVHTSDPFDTGIKWMDSRVMKYNNLYSVQMLIKPIN